jgi:hypothetical protein
MTTDVAVFIARNGAVDRVQLPDGHGCTRRLVHRDQGYLIDGAYRPSAGTSRCLWSLSTQLGWPHLF